MQKSNFYEFTRPVQERFIGSVNGTGMPTPILERRGGPSLPIYWLALAGLGLGVDVVMFPLGLGKLESRLAIQSLPIMGTYMVGIAAVVLGVMMTLAAWREVKALPFRPGVYVFPIGLVDARAYVLKVYPLAEITKVEPRGTQLTLSVEGGQSYTFSFASPADLESAVTKFESARTHLEQAHSTRESLRPGALAGIDPFHGAASPFVPNKPIIRVVPLWARIPWAFAIAVGVVIGFGIWMVRNRLGDARLYAAALEQNDIAGYEAYLVRGRTYLDDVEKVRLPRAELRAAEKSGSVEAIEQYIQTHPTSAISDEVAQARRTALLQELDRARQVGTVTALRDFDAHHPKHGLDPELKKAIHLVYAAALDRYRAQYAPKDEAAAKFMEQVIAVAEQKGPAAQIRFHPKSSKTLDKADGLIAKSKMFNGTQSFPSKYFDLPHLQPSENDAAAAIIARFSEAFPKDILSVQLGDLVGDPDAPLPAVTVPTLFVEHTVEWAGGLVTSTNPRGVFIGAGVTFESSFRLPNDTKPLRFKTADWRAPDVSQMKGELKPEEKVYDSMVRGGFDSFTKRFLATLFRAPPK